MPQVSLCQGGLLGSWLSLLRQLQIFHPVERFGNVAFFVALHTLEDEGSPRRATFSK
jgi:hypothetical protein